MQVRQPLFFTRNLTTTVHMRDGETMVFGGTDHEVKNQTTYFFLTSTTLPELDPERILDLVPLAQQLPKVAPPVEGGANSVYDEKFASSGIGHGLDEVGLVRALG